MIKLNDLDIILNGDELIDPVDPLDVSLNEREWVEAQNVLGHFQVPSGVSVGHHQSWQDLEIVNERRFNGPFRSFLEWSGVEWSGVEEIE